MSYLMNFIPRTSPSYELSTAQERYGDKRKPTASEIAQHEEYVKKMAAKGKQIAEEYRAARLGIATPNISAAARLRMSAEYADWMGKERFGHRLSEFYGAHPGLLQQHRAVEKALSTPTEITTTKQDENGIYKVTILRTPTGKKIAGRYRTWKTDTLKTELIRKWTPEEKIEYKVNRILSKTHAPRYEGGRAGDVGMAKIPSKAEIQFLRENRPDLLRPSSPIYNAIKGELLKVYADNPQILREMRRYDPSLFKTAPTVKVAIGHPTIMLPSAHIKQLEDIRKKREAEYNKQLEARQKAMKAAGLSITRQVPILKTIGVFKIK